MLLRLSVENYALIDSLLLEPDPNLNIITGETGAGKSILLGAVGLLLGARSDSSVLRDTARNCIIEGTFGLEGLHLESFFEENELDYAPETTLTRILTPAGKSRSFINDLPVPLTLLRDLGTRLIDIHSQHRNLVLSSGEFRISVLDAAAGNGTLLERYGAAYDRMAELGRRLETLRADAAEGRRNEEWLRFQTEELTAANLRAGEQAEIETELGVLEHADRIGDALTRLRNDLDEDETGILARLKSAETALGHLRRDFPAAGSYADRIRSAMEELKDIGQSAAADCERIDADPERLARLSARLDTLLALQQKHRAADEAGLLALRDRCTAQLAAIVHGDEAIAEAETALSAAREEVLALGQRLHDAREQAAGPFCEEIIRTLSRLGMADARFEAAFTPAEPGRTGCDEVAFLFSANPGMPPQRIERIASGGELSRVMLALKALLARRMQLPTIVFDEIDTGVSGRIADAMGEIIEQLSASLQVIDITHLPQVASKGTAHFVVSKHEGRTSIARLTDEERTTEIAKMLSGSAVTEAALTQARILLGR